ncbi:MAG TPA: tRNA glutamyl-Q(34) synthetase GluQRS [Rhizomicrobium sp.]|jgi:glutamyl-Q tRNA(Asp) synthetase|nr:tRNA glutamyl-Q(34) synthetase GluQRS [Rhizomicrobium sp.]
MIVTRFAPSPTGYLHIGHAYAAIRAHDAGERFLLRIEDIDRARCKPGFEEAIFEDLSWLGLAWEKPVLRQSDRSDAYREAIDQLGSQGLIYPCFCTRKEIADEIARAVSAPHGAEGPLYPGTCRALSAETRRERAASGLPYALRLDTAKAAERTGDLTFVEHGKIHAVDPLLLGDVVLARKDMPAAYHLAVVVDDAFQGVTLVTRGDDLLPATHVQRLLRALLDLPELAYAHHKLILDAQGKKFSKRDFAATLRELRANGETPSTIRAHLGLS